MQEVEQEREGRKTDQVYEYRKEDHSCARKEMVYSVFDEGHLSFQLCYWSKLNQRRKCYDSSSVKHEILLLEIDEAWETRRFRFRSGKPCSGREDGPPKA